ncbi:MAG: 3-hydroxybutyryl-CoA dehydrogenase [Acidiferrobacteraceae bacterium]|jgi:3-hydroxybutyryl-CoA dehydrogenase|nr:3-hydroxybutyryl-CoA dehydrogenase [Acidiferrobacteraceae bacterium]MBF40622.1 3-hydroxybutyryl-CoA dehydrogenase [Acidiferrobacteraceae bacterium]HAN60534.1 3-hydroxybutyryl-CoA dehydrogenase [Gammaproteobacteria bacterium]HIA87024.1 3-hydroxybutyryl-CoA dehydrogenase [Gammaproteobacteria bacterium]
MATRTIGLVGAGTMGSGIAQAGALSGYDVTMQDISDEQVAKGIKGITKSLERLAARDKISSTDQSSALARIEGTTTLDDLAECDVVIEAATENMDLKIAVFAQLDALCKSDTILASNTSSLSITRLAAATRRPDRVIGLHFFNPVPIMKLVEIVRALQTSDETFTEMDTLTRQLGKEPVSVQDSPGFVVNRMLVPMINEAIFVLHEGLASAEEIDTAMKLGANHPIGPLALADMIGIDVCLFVMEILHNDFADSKFRPCPLLKKMVNAGYLGRKSGRGFFDYSQ